MDLLKDSLIQNLVLPVLLGLASAFVLIIKHYLQKLTESILSKNKIDSLVKRAATRNEILSEISTIVQFAVFTNMALANKLKGSATDNKLSDEDVKVLHNNTLNLVYKSLPSDYTDENSTIMKMIGGKDKLDNIILNMIESSLARVKRS